MGERWLAEGETEWGHISAKLHMRLACPASLPPLDQPRPMRGKASTNPLISLDRKIIGQFSPRPQNLPHNPAITLAGTRVMNRMRVEGDGAGSARGGGVLGDEP